MKRNISYFHGKKEGKVRRSSIVFIDTLQRRKKLQLSKNGNGKEEG
jgi:hypothetical protein